MDRNKVQDSISEVEAKLDIKLSDVESLVLQTKLEAYQTGVAYEEAGRGFLDNPYKQDTIPFRLYIDGYVASTIARRK